MTHKFYLMKTKKSKNLQKLTSPCFPLHPPILHLITGTEKSLEPLNNFA